MLCNVINSLVSDFVLYLKYEIDIRKTIEKIGWTQTSFRCSKFYFQNHEPLVTIKIVFISLTF